MIDYILKCFDLPTWYKILNLSYNKLNFILNPIDLL